MKLTSALHRDNFRWLFKTLWSSRYSRAKEGFLNKPSYLDKAGIPVTKPADVLSKNEPVFPEWSPEVPDDIQFKPLPTIKDDPDYHEEAIYQFTPDSKLLEGENQACILSKSQLFRGLPPSVERLVGSVSIPDQDWMMQKIIMQSHKWEPTKVKLPKRINPDLPIWKFKAEFGIPDYKIATLTLQNILQLCGTLIGEHPKLLDLRRTVLDVQLSTYFNYLDEHHVSIKGNTDGVIFSSQPLEPFADNEVIDQSVQHALPNIYPVLPTIDLKMQHVWNYDNVIGYREGFKFPFPNTIFLCYDDKWTTSQYNAKSLMFSYGYAVGLAKKLYGDNVKILPKPISIQCVQTNGINFDFTCFQLNNLDYNIPVKNLVWFDSENALFNKVIPKRAMLRHTKFIDYNPDVIKKLLAFYINGTNIQNI